MEIKIAVVMDDPFCGAGGVLGSVFVGSIGYSIGTAVGVSRVDPHDLFGASLIGSVVGLVGGDWVDECQ